jgi:hypothetical protein
MPQTLVPTDATASSVDAVAAVFGTLRDGDADARPAATTACPPRLRRVVAFMSAHQAIPPIHNPEDSWPTRTSIKRKVARRKLPAR